MRKNSIVRHRTDARSGAAMAQQKDDQIGFVSTFTVPVAAIVNDMRNSFELRSPT